MTAQIDVDDFLEHFGVPGMKWGRKRNARRDDSSSSKSVSGSGGSIEKPKMSRNKKIAIGIGVGVVVAVGAAVVLSSMNKNMDLPIKSLVDNDSTKKGSKAYQAHEKRMTEVMNRMNLEKDSPLKTRSDLNAYRDKAVKDSGLTLGPRSATAPSSGTSTTLNRGTSTPTYPRSASGMNSAPSLDTLSKLMNGGPQVNFNPKTGKYETR